MSRTAACSWLLLGLLPLLGGCATYAMPGNQPLRTEAAGAGYGLGRDRPGQNRDDLTVAVAFSGGGARAAALAHGVLLELHDTRIPSSGGEASLLAEVDAISAVSGGSVTAAYYALHGTDGFPAFEQAVLRRDFNTELLRGVVFNPLRWFSPLGRTAAAANLFDRAIFHGARFADLQARNAPLVIINASDLESGTRFSFLQGYFDLLCSDLSSYRLADAVAASSAVPVMFEPVVLENRGGCSPPPSIAGSTQASPQLQQAAEGLQNYADKQARRYIHLADGGLTDNLGLRAFQESVDMAGGLAAFLRSIQRTPGAHLVVVSVDASGNAASGLGLSRQAPSITRAIDTMTDVLLHRYNAATLELMQESLQRWTAEVARTGSPVRSHLVAVSLGDVADPHLRKRLQAVSTGFSLTPLQVDELVAAGRSLLRENPAFRALLGELRNGETDR